MLAVWIGGALGLYYASQAPPVGNFLWQWEFSWSSLGYPQEDFEQRQRTAFLAFTFAGSAAYPPSWPG